MVVLPKGSIARGVRGAILRATAPPAPPSVAPVWVVCRSCVVDREGRGPSARRGGRRPDPDPARSGRSGQQAGTSWDLSAAAEAGFSVISPSRLRGRG